MSRYPQEDTTKPSRLNRRRKKRWKISGLIKNSIGFESNAFMLSIIANHGGMIRSAVL